MNAIEDRKILNVQYSTDENLTVRIGMHQKYSSNPIGYVNWLFDQYSFKDNMKILELGCGNGDMWSSRTNFISKNSNLVLSDISQGMVDIVKEKFNKYKNIESYKIDIIKILFEASVFDMIIANSMFYHIDDIKKAISEVARVLNKDGKFYCTTTGDNGMPEFLHNSLKEFDENIDAFNQNNFNFNEINAEKILKKSFKKVEKRVYIDSLQITDVNDLIKYIKSTATIISADEINFDKLFEFYESKKDGNQMLIIPKRMILYICQK